MLDPGVGPYASFWHDLNHEKDRSFHSKFCSLDYLDGVNFLNTYQHLSALLIRWKISTSWKEWANIELKNYIW